MLAGRLFALRISTSERFPSRNLSLDAFACLAKLDHTGEEPMRTLWLCCAVVAASGVYGSVEAQETQTYAYDVHGRLVSVSRATGALGSVTTYALDNADNRTARTTTVSGSLAVESHEGPATASAVSSASLGGDAPQPSSTEHVDVKRTFGSDQSTSPANAGER